MLEAQIVALSREHPTQGYRKISGMLRRMGYAVNKKQVQRIRREEGLQVPPPRVHVRRQGVSTGLPQKAEHRNHVWAWDFVADYTQRGGKLRVFTLIDEYTRECHVLHTDRSITAENVLGVLKQMIGRHGAPRFIRSDNGPEFIATCIQRWLRENQIATIYIDPGCPWQNGYAESFNSRLRMECLDREVIHTLSEARVIFEDWRDYYNQIRPHRSLGLKTPSEYAKELDPQCKGIAPQIKQQHKSPEISH